MPLNLGENILLASIAFVFLLVAAVMVEIWRGEP